MSAPLPSHRELYARLRERVLSGPGELDPAARRAAFEGSGPEGALAWVRRVRDQAATIEDAHMEALRASGLSEDQAFELTIAAAVGAADLRLRAALRSLGEEEP